MKSVSLLIFYTFNNHSKFNGLDLLNSIMVYFFLKIRKKEKNIYKRGKDINIYIKEKLRVKDTPLTPHNFPTCEKDANKNTKEMYNYDTDKNC